MLALLLAVACGATAEMSESLSAPFVPKAVLYGYPTSTAAVAASPVVGQDWGVYGAFGTSVRLSERIGVDAELALGHLDTVREASPGWIFSLGAGPSFQLTGDEPFRGLFITTRFRFEAFQPAKQLVFFDGAGNHGPVDLGPGTARAFLAEVDVGYHFRFGRFYVAPIIGIGLGYSYDYADHTGVGFLLPASTIFNPTNRPQGLVWSLNLNLARMGVAL